MYLSKYTSLTLRTPETFNAVAKVSANSPISSANDPKIAPIVWWVRFFFVSLQAVT